MHALPILVIGGIFLLGSKRKKRRAEAKKPIPLPIPPRPSQGDTFFGTGEHRPDLIRVGSGEKFSVIFPLAMGGNVWKLAASPPDNSIDSLGSEAKMMDGQSVVAFQLQGAKPGKGSLVFHFLNPALENQAPLQDIVEILTEVV